MTLPDGISMDEFLAAADRVAAVLVRKFNFPASDDEDVAQLVRLHAWEALPRYRPEAGGLGAFLYRHCRNQLSNKLRTEVSRTDYPCEVCYERQLGFGDGHPDGSVCPLHVSWWERNAAKAAIARPLDFAQLHPEGDSAIRKDSATETDAEIDEVLVLIDEQLPVELRSAYLRMRAGETVPIHLRDRVERAVLDILADSGLGPEDLGLAQSGEDAG